MPSTTSPILVTGAHRSGTTWVGRMLAASPEVGYIHEPFNVTEAAPWLRPPMPHWFHYVCVDNEDEHAARIAAVLRFRFPPGWPGSWGAARSAAKRTLLSWEHRRRRARPLVKDPIALLSTPWLVERFDVVPVVLVRHPAAFASSLLRLGWRFDFRQLLDQPLLLRDLLGPFEADLRAADSSDDEITRAAVLWRVLYGAVDRFRSEHPDWCVVRHEDLAGDPETGFRTLYDRVGLRFDERARRVVVEHSSGSGGEHATHDVRRDSGAVPGSWGARLSSSDAERIRNLVGDVGERFYAASEWQVSARPV